MSNICYLLRKPIKKQWREIIFQKRMALKMGPRIKDKIDFVIADKSFNLEYVTVINKIKIG